MARSKRLKLDPAADRLVGVQPRKKLDLFAGCNEPGKEWFMPDAHAFMRAWCRHCKSPDCIRAGAGSGPWQARMQAQVDYLINDPQFSDLEKAEHKALAAMMFESLNAKAERLEIAARRQDWEIPETPSDGFDRLAEPETTSSFDEAVKELARAQGKKEPTLPVPDTAEGPTHFQQQEEEAEDEEGEAEEEEEDDDPEAPEYETQFPSSDGKRRYHVMLSKQGRWSCACNGFKHVRKCKHIETVRAWYQEEFDRLEQEERAAKENARIEEFQRRQAPPQAPPPQARPPQPDPRVPTQRPLNTPMPTTGVMVGGGTPPPVPPTRAPREAPDPWAPRQETIVEPGATVTLKPRKKS